MDGRVDGKERTGGWVQGWAGRRGAAAAAAEPERENVHGWVWLFGAGGVSPSTPLEQPCCCQTLVDQSLRVQSGPN
jgi:hypothetical protein